MSTIIFDEADRNRTVRYKVKGCEKVIVVRSDLGLPFNLDIETMSQNDPHYRINPLMNINTSGDYQIDMMPIACGMDLIFRIDAGIDPNSHLFVEILYETCVPEKCCPCK